MSGCSALRITIFAARRVLPPDLMTPANASKPFMNETGPEAVPPPASSSFDERMDDRLLPVPEPYLKSMPSVLRQREDRLHRVVDRVDEARRALRRLLEAAVEPDRAVERGLLLDEQMLEIAAEGREGVVGREIASASAPTRKWCRRPGRSSCSDRPFALGRPDVAAEVLRDDDVGGLLRPGLRHLDLALLEDDLPFFAADDGVAQLPFDLIERVGSGRRKKAREFEPARPAAFPAPVGGTSVLSPAA